MAIYGVFISYSHADKAQAAWIQRRLEAFRTPRPLRGKHGLFGLVPSGVGRVYRDTTDFAAGGHLEDSIRRTLDTSEALLVLCSSAAAASSYVDLEIRYFQALGRGDRIFTAIVDDTPPDCFPDAIRSQGVPVAADLRRETGEPHRGLQKILAGLLGVSHDDLVRRQEIAQRWRNRTAAGLAAAFAALAAISAISAVAARTNEARALANERMADGERRRAEAARADALLQRDAAERARRLEVQERERADAAKSAADASRQVAEAQRDAARTAEAKAIVALASLEADRENWSAARNLAAGTLAKGELTASERRKLEALLVQSTMMSRATSDVRVTGNNPWAYDDPRMRNLAAAALDDRGEFLALIGLEGLRIVRTRDVAEVAAYSREQADVFVSVVFNPQEQVFVAGIGRQVCLRAPRFELLPCSKAAQQTPYAPRLIPEQAVVTLRDGRKSELSLDTAGYVTLSPTGDYGLLNESRRVSIWRLAAPTGQRIMEFSATVRDGVLEGVGTFSPNGRYVAISPGRGEILVIDIERRLVTRLVGHHDFVVALAFDDDRSELVSFDQSAHLRRWRLEQGLLPRWQASLPVTVQSAAMDPSGARFVAGGTDGVVITGAVEGGAGLKAHKLGSARVTQVASGLRTAVAAQSDGNVSAIDLASGVTRTLVAHDETVLSIALDEPSAVVATGSADDLLLVQDIRSGGVRCRIDLGASATSVAFAGPTAGLVVAASSDVSVWRVEDCKLVTRFRLPEGLRLKTLHYEPTNGTLLAGAATGDVLFGRASDRTLRSLGRVPGGVGALSPASGGVVADGAGLVRMLDIPNRALGGPYRVVEGSLDGVALSGDARSALYWKGARLWASSLWTAAPNVIEPKRRPSERSPSLPPRQLTRPPS